MARYYFHTEGAHRFQDEAGHEFPDETDVAAEALDFLSESLRNAQASFWETSSYRVVVTDAEGLILYVLDLSGVEAPAIKRRRLAALNAKPQAAEELRQPAEA